MSFYSTETELVRALVVRFRRAASVADDVADQTMHALALSALDTPAVGEAIRIAEGLERAAADLANYSHDVDDSESQNRFKENGNQIGRSFRTTW